MARLTDGRKTVEITMRTWDEDSASYSPDWSNDFFDGAEEVPDVDWCIDQAKDWEKGEGDFYDPDVTKEEIANRMVLIEEF